MKGKIKSIEVYNFQPYVSSILNLAAGVNIITGASDKGKSAIMRLLRWVFRNKPRGFAFRSSFAKEDETVKGVVSFDDDTFVGRERGEGLNCYLTPTHDESDPLDTIGTDVPDEVLSIVNIDDYCFRGQHDPYFLLQDTPGGVGRTLNEIVGWSEIDDVRKKIKKIISKSESSFENAEAEEKKLRDELAFYDNLDAMQKDIDKLGKMLRERDLLRQERTELYKICRELQNLEDDIEQLDLWLKIEEESKDLFVLLDEHNADMREKNAIQELIDGIEEINGEIADIDFDLEYYDEISKIAEDIRIYKKEVIILEEIKQTVGDIETIDDEIPYIEAKIRHIDDQILSIGICPYCGGEISRDHECK